MQIFEDVAKRILDENGIRVPKYFVITDPKEAGNAVSSINGDSVVKPLGIKGRGKQGLVYFAKSSDEAQNAVNALLGREVNGEKIMKVIVEEKIDIDKEIYMSIAIDTTARRPVFIVSRNGGVNIEEISKKDPKSIIKIPIDITAGFDQSILENTMKQIDSKNYKILMDAALKLYSIFRKYDATLVEINPIAETKNSNEVVAIDAIMSIDDDALFRQDEIQKLAKDTKEKNKIEEAMRALGWSYVELDGDIGIICSGAGLSMATLDLLRIYGGRPANFLDMAQVNGEGIYKALEIMTQHERVKAILIHLFAGLNDCGLMAEGVKKFVNEKNPKIKIITRMVGNNEEKGDEVLKSVGIENIHSLEDALKKIVLVTKNGNIN